MRVLMLFLSGSILPWLMWVISQSEDGVMLEKRIGDMDIAV